MDRTLSALALLAMFSTATLNCRGARDNSITRDVQDDVAPGPPAHGRPEDKIQHAATAWPKIESHMAATCQRTGGRWKPNMVQCICQAENQVFLQHQGCVAVATRPYRWHCEDPESTSSEWRSDGGPDFPHMRLWIGDRYVDEDTRKTMSALLAQDPLKPFRGVIVPDDADHARSLSMGMVPSKTAFNVRFHHLPRIGTALLPPTESIPIESLVTPDPHVLDPAVCTAAVLAAQGPSSRRQDVATLCQRLEDARQAMLGEEPVPYDFWDSGSDCKISCGLHANKSSHGFGVHTAIFMARHLPVGRMIEASGTGGHSAAAYLDPTGRVAALQWRKHQVRRQGTVGLVDEWKELILNSKLDMVSQIVSQEDSEMPLDEDELQKILSAFRGHRRVGAGTGLRAMLVENDFSGNDDKILPQLNIANMIDNSRTFDSWLVGPGMSWRDEQLTAVHNATSAVHAAHANIVAELLLQDLPGAELSALPHRLVWLSGDPDVIFREWSVSISRYRPAVVNISLHVGFYGDDCARSMGRLFAEHPDVLFVAGAGNSGRRNGVNVCPAGLWPDHPNLITVAATEEAGKLAWYSSYGRELATVATNGDALITRGRGEDQVKKMTSGTSIAAPRLGNLALKMMQYKPGLSPARIVAAMRASCSDDHLDVACGGEVTETGLREAGWLP